MTLWLRTILFFKRNVSKTLIIYLIITVLSSVIFTGRTISCFCGMVRKEFINNLGTIIKVSNRLEDDISDSKIWSQSKDDKQDYFNQYTSVLNSFLSDDRIKDINFSLYMFAYLQDTDHYVPIELCGIPEEGFDDPEQDNIEIISGNAHLSGNLCLIPEGLSDDEILGIYNILFDSDNGFFTIEKGFELEKAIYSFPVAGVYRNNKEQLRRFPVVYVSNDTVERLHSEMADWKETYDILREVFYGSQELTAMGIRNVVFKVREMEDLSEVSYDLGLSLLPLDNSSENIEESDILIRSSYDEYSSVEWFVDRIEKYAAVIERTVRIAFGIVLTMVMFLVLKGRKREMGLLMTMGIRKSSLIIQGLLEVALLGSAAVITGYMVSYFISEQVFYMVAYALSGGINPDYVPAVFLYSEGMMKDVYGQLAMLLIISAAVWSYHGSKMPYRVLLYS